MNYSLDGQPSQPLPVNIVPDNRNLQFQSAEHSYGVVTLPTMSNGTHTITVYADGEFAGAHLTQITVTFNVQGN